MIQAYLQTVKIAALILVSWSGSLHAATIEKLPGTGITWQHHDLTRVKKADATCNILLRGEILPGEGNRLSEEINALANPKEVLFGTPESERTVSVLCLDSPGGSLGTALEIVENIRVATRIRNGDRCFSACAIIFMSGHFAFDEWAPVLWRVIEPGGSLGFHAPSLGKNVNLKSEGQVREIFQSTVATIGQISGRMMAGKNSYLDGYFPATLFEIMLTTPPNDMFIVDTVDEAARWKIDVATNWRKSEVINLDLFDIARICESSLLWDEHKSAVPFLLEGNGKYNAWSVESNSVTYVYNSYEGVIPSPWCKFELNLNHGLGVGWISNPDYKADLLGKKVITVNLSEQRELDHTNFRLFPPDTKLTDLKFAAGYVSDSRKLVHTDLRENDLENSVAKNIINGCSMGSEYTRAHVINVNNFVNIRQNASLKSLILTRANLGERLEILQSFEWPNLDPRGKKCREMCTMLLRSPSDISLARQVRTCTNNKQIWAKVRHNGQVGYVSTYFMDAE